MPSGSGRRGKLGWGFAGEERKSAAVAVKPGVKRKEER